MFSTTLKRAVACSTIASLAFIQSKNSYCEMPHAHHNYPRSVDEEKYVRIDTEIIASEFFKQFARKNAFHETLNGEGMIESLELYAKKDADLDDSAELLCVIKYGDSVNGHPGIVHGGILALTFDNCFGWVFFADRQSAGFTANLNINYR